MSTTTEHDIEATDTDGEDEGVLRRTFAADFAPGEGRTVDLRIVPYGERGIAADGLGGLPRGVPYEEEWMPGVFNHQTNAANRVVANFEHQLGIAGIVGHGVALRDTAGGFQGSFKLHETPDGDKALMLVKEGVLAGVSLEAVPVKSVRTTAGVVQRVKAHLKAVALCREPAFPSARVLAVREEVILDETLLPLALNAETIERCRRLGIALPDRYQEQPVDDDEAEIEELLKRAFTDMAWDGSSSRWDTAEAYCAASAIDLNPSGEAKTKDRCHLPFKEPGSGDINVNGVRAALSRIGQGFPQDATQAQRDRAKAMLERMLNTFNSKQGN